jgi:D-alanyl-D-alanine carboxypeptidase
LDEQDSGLAGAYPGETNLRRVYRAVIILPSLILAMLAVRPVLAATPIKIVNFSESTYTRGFSFTEETNQFRLVVEPGTFSGPATLSVDRLDSETLPELAGRTRQTAAWRVTVATAVEAALLKPIQFEFTVPDPGLVTDIGKLLADGSGWEPLGFTVRADGTRASAADDKLSFTVALFQQEGVMAGVATYYGTYVRTTRLTMVAASNHFTNGTALRVTNLDNGKTVTVKVVDTGAFRYPRVIDLSTPAFAKIQPTWKGVARVRVEKATPWNRPSATVDEGGDQPAVGVPISDGATPPATAATASIVVDAASGAKLVGKKISTAMPIASLTKVVTAAVFLDTRPDLTQLVSYSAADDTICSCLRLADGEQVTLKDLLFASLVGSANNATLALVRASGLSRPEFVNRMNAKAAELNLQQTFFVDPTGLEAGNVSTTEDLAVIGRLIPDQYPAIRKAMGSRSYWFRSKNDLCRPGFKNDRGQCQHRIQSTNKLQGKTSFDIVAAKTGYIDEARHTFLLRGKNKAGREVVLVFLRVDRKAESFAHANALIDWTFEHFRWT